MYVIILACRTAISELQAALELKTAVQDLIEKVTATVIVWHYEEISHIMHICREQSAYFALCIAVLHVVTV